MLQSDIELIPNRIPKHGFKNLLDRHAHQEREDGKKNYNREETEKECHDYTEIRQNVPPPLLDELAER